MIAQTAAVLCVLLAAAQAQVCHQADADTPCEEGKGRAGSAMLQTDVGATVQQGPATEVGVHDDSQSALLLETGKTEVAAKYKTKAAPLVGKVNALVEEVTQLDTQVAGLEKAVGIGKTGPADVAPATALPAAPPPTPFPATMAEAAPEGTVPDGSDEEGGPVEPVSMLDAPPEEEPLMGGLDSLNLRQENAERAEFFGQRAGTRNFGGRQSRQYPMAAYPQTHQQPMALMRKSSVVAPAGSLKSKVAELEGKVADISSRIVSLENEVVGHAVSSLLELDATSKLSETPMVAAALNSRIVSQQQTQAASSGMSSLYTNALKTRALKMEETIDDLKTRAHTLTQEVLR